VLQHRADLGIAFDGDGDRVVMADQHGNLLDGDQLLYVIAAQRREAGRLQGGVVGTLMSNLGFEHALARLEIPFARAKVGDRYVLELMQHNGWQLGGENSGHIICLDKHSSGDGIIAALQVLAAVREAGKPLAALVADVALYPQVLVNVGVKRKIDLAGDPAIQQAVQAAEAELADSGRVLLRASGTEPKVRVMVEGRDRARVASLAQGIAAVVEAAAAA